MKKMLSLTLAAAAVVASAAPSLGQAPKAAPATPPAAASKEAPNAAMVKNLTGEFVAIDKAAKTVTVKSMIDKEAAQITFSVDEVMLTTLAQFKPGDKVKVSYEEMGQKLIAKTIVKGWFRRVAPRGPGGRALGSPRTLARRPPPESRPPNQPGSFVNTDAHDPGVISYQ